MEPPEVAPPPAVAAAPAPASERAPRAAECASARKAFDAAEAVWGATSEDAAEREASRAALGALYFQATRLGLAALAPEGQLQRWADAATWEAEAPANVRAQLPFERAAGLASGVLPRAVSEAELVVARAQAAAVLSIAEGPARRLEAQRVERVTRALVLLAVALVVAGMVAAGITAVLRPRDLAPGHPWKTSTQLPNCFPEQGLCGGARLKILFHTQEEDSPWWELDLERPTALSAVTVVNRQDVALHRAVPLVVEVSDDQQRWRQVARRDDEFDTWRARFPTQTARYVRLRVARRTQFHLEAVRVHP